MSTLHQFFTPPSQIPAVAAWYMADLGEARGRQDLYTSQSPQRLKTLREHALLESAVSSNRIEGVEVEQSRIGTVLFGERPLRDRNEEELHGYRSALSWLHAEGSALPLTTQTILELHRLSRGGMGDAGEYRQRDIDIIERQPGGEVRVRFDR